MRAMIVGPDITLSRLTGCGAEHAPLARAQALLQGRLQPFLSTLPYPSEAHSTAEGGACAERGVLKAARAKRPRPRTRRRDKTRDKAGTNSGSIVRSSQGKRPRSAG